MKNSTKNTQKHVPTMAKMTINSQDSSIGFGEVFEFVCACDTAGREEGDLEGEIVEGEGEKEGESVG